MNPNQRETLSTCLTQVFGRVEDSFVDEALQVLEWIELGGGATLFEEGDGEDGVYFVISGRLRASVSDEGAQRTIGEIGRGETIGEMAVLTQEPRSATIAAIRDSVLAHASRSAFEKLMLRHPELPIHVARLIIGRAKRAATRPKPKGPTTVCLLAVSENCDAQSFGEALAKAVDRWGVAALESSASIDARFGAGAAQTPRGDSEAYHKVTLWLDDLEFWNQQVLLVADAGDTEWTRRCLRHADEILLLAQAEAPIRLHPLESAHLSGSQAITGARQTLVLLRDAAERHPANTAAWLDRRRVDSHLQVRLSRPRDMARLARIVSGNAIGLVFGGGGARGFAHLGAYQALEEAGIAVDFVGGTSIGAVMAAYVSLDVPARTLVELARSAFSKDPTGDVNLLPLISLVRGRRLKSIIDKAVVAAAGHAARMEDSWRTLFCVATNFSDAGEQVLSRGDLARSVRASVSIPVALPPVVVDGDLLIDGGTFNNFPTDVMVRMGARRVIGVDLGRDKGRKYDLDEVPSPWALLLDRLRPRGKRRYRLPSLGTVLMETTILYSVSRRRYAQQSVDLYLNPAVGRIGLLEWKAFDSSVRIGYEHTQQVLARMSAEELEPYLDEPG